MCAKDTMNTSENWHERTADSHYSFLHSYDRSWKIGCCSLLISAVLYQIRQYIIRKKRNSFVYDCDSILCPGATIVGGT